MCTIIPISSLHVAFKFIVLTTQYLCTFLSFPYWTLSILWVPSAAISDYDNHPPQPKNVTENLTTENSVHRVRVPNVWFRIHTVHTSTFSYEIIVANGRLSLGLKCATDLTRGNRDWVCSSIWKSCPGYPWGPQWEMLLVGNTNLVW